ncbi:hypothetical protein ABIF29_002312 [Bradyrhizobium elkanii]|uniref:Uncharacterized protein n=1 Tax=Bradyrhizobium elkanii TaxID=29448 RepID=A0ABV4EXK2_BRAEL|nr:hypothetical protein [Bradyrhizobium elkanii]MCP1982047.1 hypothetical protein [Bradyrhizobium elkanii]MCS3883169.1 hypothetical protein [Bradyrhizobium elkanii]MCS4217774.1 hypothetical protein [Bradyrhizobium elkanii]MCW2195776.1 hypothetical protein [Bradyrhizobium elkanii]
MREWLVQPLPGEEEEIDHLDVGRERAAMQCIGIGEIRIAAEQAIDHRSDEAPFEQALRLRLFQRQCGEQRQIDGAVGRCSRIQRVDDVVGLAEAEGSPTTSSVPTSRMMCSAIASGSEKKMGISNGPGGDGG